MHFRIAAVFIVVVWVSGSLQANEASPDTRRAVALLYTPPCPFLLEMEGELRAAGFVPILMAEDPSAENPLLPAEAAARVDAFAAVRILSSGEGVTVFAMDAVRRVHLSTEVANADAGAQSGRVTAIKTVELLRVALMETAPEEAPPSVPPPEKPAAEVPKSRPRESARVLASGAPAVTYGFGGVPAAFQVDLCLCVRPVQRIRLFVSGLVPTFAGTVRGEGGRAAVKTGLLAVGMDAELTDPDHRVAPYIGILGGALFARAEGTSDRESAQGRQATAVAATVQMHAGLSLRLSRRVALRGDVAFGAVFPEPVIRIEGKEAASFGRPILTGDFGVEVRLF